MIAQFNVNISYKMGNVRKNVIQVFIQKKFQPEFVNLAMSSALNAMVLPLQSVLLVNRIMHYLTILVLENAILIVKHVLGQIKTTVALVLLI